MRRFHVDVEGGQLSGIAFGDPVRPVDSLFVHANGFNAITYQSILAPLGLRAHVAAIDLRGHGRSTAEANPSKLMGWNTFRDDIIAAIEQLAPQGTVLAGHSMGATISTLVAGKRPDLVTGLVLVDPVLMAPAFYRNMYLPGVPSMTKKNSRMSKMALKRRNSFESQEAAVTSFTGRGAFKSWRTPFLEDYVTDGVVPNESGEGFRLACDPAWEAACFGAHRHNPWRALQKIEAPIVLIKAEKESTCPRASAQRFMKTRPYTVLMEPSGTSHFVPMERPYVVRDSISEYLARFVEGFAAGDEGRVLRNLDSYIGEKD